MYSSILLRNIWTDGEYTLEIVADFKVYTYKHIYFHIYWKSRLLRNQIAYLRVITKRQERPGFHLHLYDTGFTKPFLWGFFISVVCKSVGLNQKTESSCGLFEWTKKQASLRTSVRTSDLPLGPSHLHFFDTPPSSFLPIFFLWRIFRCQGPWGFLLNSFLLEKVCGDFYNLPLSLTSTKILRPFPIKLCFQLAIRNKYLNELSSRLPGSWLLICVTCWKSMFGV